MRREESVQDGCCRSVDGQVKVCCVGAALQRWRADERAGGQTSRQTGVVQGNKALLLTGRHAEVSRQSVQGGCVGEELVKSKMEWSDGFPIEQSNVRYG